MHSTEKRQGAPRPACRGGRGRRGSARRRCRRLARCEARRCPGASRCTASAASASKLARPRATAAFMSSAQRFDAARARPWANCMSCGEHFCAHARRVGGVDVGAEVAQVGASAVGAPASTARRCRRRAGGARRAAPAPRRRASMRRGPSPRARVTAQRAAEHDDAAEGRGDVESVASDMHSEGARELAEHPVAHRARAQLAADVARALLLGDRARHDSLEALAPPRASRGARASCRP